MIGNPGSGAEEAVQCIAHAEHGTSLGIWLDARHYGDRAALLAAVAEKVLQGLLGSETLRRWRAGEPPSTDALAALGSRRSAELARRLTMSDAPQTSSISQVLALPPQGTVLCIGWAHLLAERQMGGLLWELRASVMGGEGKIALVLSTFPATRTSVIGEQAPLFGIGEELEIADPTTERWREIVRVGELPVSDGDLLWLLLRTGGQARATAEVLALTRSAPPGARWGARRIWEQESERALAAVGDAVSFARAVNPHGPALMSAIAAETGPYRVLRPYANAKQIARALGQLAYHGLVYSPRRGRWLLGNPLLRDALVDLDRETESAPL
ncbi:MAG: hypothetical protein ACRDK4_02360 [Solirubrobacteraceae bacterium]